MVGVGELSESKNYPCRRIIIRVGGIIRGRGIIWVGKLLGELVESKIIWVEELSDSQNYPRQQIIWVRLLSESENYWSWRTIGFGELSESDKYRSQRIIRVGELSESGNCQSLLIIGVRELFKSANCPSLQHYCSLRTILKKEKVFKTLNLQNNLYCQLQKIINKKKQKTIKILTLVTEMEDL